MEPTDQIMTSELMLMPAMLSGSQEYLRLLWCRLCGNHSGQEVVEFGWVDVAHSDDAEIWCGGGVEGEAGAGAGQRGESGNGGALHEKD